MQVDGDIVINGRPIGTYMKHLSGYMPQEDLFVGSLTVLEHMHIMVNSDGNRFTWWSMLRFQAHLKLDRLISSQEKSSKIKTILNQLGLRRCANTCIGARGHKGLSGGEKKRLAFATEVRFCSVLDTNYPQISEWEKTLNWYFCQSIVQSPRYN